MFFKEAGVFPALKEGYIRGLQLSIFEDASKPSNIVENYTFTFNYMHSPNRTREIDGLSIALPNGPLITVKTATYAMQMLIRRLISLCNTLPDLPGMLKCPSCRTQIWFCNFEIKKSGICPCIFSTLRIVHRTLKYQVSRNH